MFISTRSMLALSMVGALAAPAAFAAPAASVNRADVEAIVKAYIQSHGDELATSIETAKAQKQMARVQKMITPATPVSGPANAPVTIVEFIDIECPYCNGVQNTIKAINTKYKGKVRFVFKALPLEFHKNARPAVYASLAAHKQGKFFEYLDVLFANQDKLGDKLYLDTAKRLKLDMKRFNADRSSTAVSAQVEADLKDAEAMEARGTPFFLVNGQPIPGALPPEAFFKVIDGELAKAGK